LWLNFYTTAIEIVSKTATMNLSFFSAKNLRERRNCLFKESTLWRITTALLHLNALPYFLHLTKIVLLYYHLQSYSHLFLFLFLLAHLEILFRHLINIFYLVLLLVLPCLLCWLYLNHQGYCGISRSVET